MSETAEAGDASEIGMKLPAAFACLAFLTLAIGQERNPQLKHLSIPPLNGNRPVSLTALHIERGVEYPSVVTLNGNVEIKTPVCRPADNGWSMDCYGEIVVRADGAKFHEDSGQIEASGHVVVTTPEYPHKQ